MMEFTDDEKLIYTIIGEKTDDVLLLTYYIDDDMIVSNQPSRPREERTQFCLTPDGKLVLGLNGKVYRYVRLT